MYRVSENFSYGQYRDCPTMDIPNFNTALVERHKIIDILLDQIARAGFCFV
jgi:hypothetical protein